MTIWIALLLGLVQGITEFLPISSSGHLVLMHNLFGVEQGTMFFTIMLHIGTLVAVIAVYYKQLWDIIRHPLQKKTLMLLVALIPTVLAAVLFKDFFEESFGGKYLGFEFLLTALILWFAQRAKTGRKNMQTMRTGDALLIGLMQSVSILPAVSRSGATIAGALYCKMERKEAADFSFLLSVPAIVGSFVFEVPSLVKSGLGDINWAFVIAGMVMSGAAGYLAVRLMLRVIKSRRLTPFIYYTATLGVLILLDQFVTNWFFARPF
ncbi:MAG TPA: undecaprenyl-diphosphate phosphatase [Feifaniaceae bacterium]|nr:undecaprenyl-diphosphate phosphatase [Feifaniaceae bacterium]